MKKSSLTLLLTTSLLLTSPMSYSQQSLDEAVSEARKRHPGRIISAETEHQAGRRIHNIRILTPDGRVRRLRMGENHMPPMGPPRARHR